MALFAKSNTWCPYGQLTASSNTARKCASVNKVPIANKKEKKFAFFVKRRERESEAITIFTVKTAKITLYSETWHSPCYCIGNSECYPLGIPLPTERLVAEFVEGCRFLLNHVKIVHILTGAGRQNIKGSTCAVSRRYNRLDFL